MLSIIKSLVSKEAARLIAYASAATVAGALWLAGLAGVELTPEIITGVSALTALVATELIRRFVYSKESVAREVAEAIAATETKP